MQYILMRKDDPITLLEISETGNIEKYSKHMMNADLAPLQERSSSDWISRWWKERSVPISQGKVKEMLYQKGLTNSETYLVNNLGLSLTDYYWIKPIESDLKWKDVNLFQNNFRDNIISFGYDSKEMTSSGYTPNSSLQGQLEKSWIIKDSARILIKGNKDILSAESINEVIASRIHEMQGYDNYTQYYLLKMKNKEYDFGCYSEAFTDLHKELVSAYGVLTSEKQNNDISSYEQFISLCVKHGMDGERLRADLEYQIMSDFIISNRDRHLSNISILRDAETLQFIRMAPVYDTGKSLFVHEAVATDLKSLLDIRTNSFAKSELKLLSYIHDRSLLDIGKLPDKQYIMDMYGMDSKMDDDRIRMIGEGYERKIELFRDFQLGKDLNQIKIAIRKPAVQSKHEQIQSLDEWLDDARKEAANYISEKYANDKIKEHNDLER